MMIASKSAVDSVLAWGATELTATMHASPAATHRHFPAGQNEDLYAFPQFPQQAPSSQAADGGSRWPSASQSANVKNCSALSKGTKARGVAVPRSASRARRSVDYTQGHRYQVRATAPAPGASVPPRAPRISPREDDGGQGIAYAEPE